MSLNTPERFKKAGLIVLAEAMDQGKDTIYVERIQMLIDKWDAEEQAASAFAVGFHKYMDKHDKGSFHPDATLQTVFKHYWHQELRKP